MKLVIVLLILAIEAPNGERGVLVNPLTSMEECLVIQSIIENDFAAQRIAMAALPEENRPERIELIVSGCEAVEKSMKDFL